jgi:hypothetical protein
VESLGLWLLSAVLVGAAVLVIHAALAVAVLRAERSTAADRVMGFVPFLAPIAGWRVGLRVLPVLWAVFVTAYLFLRLAR